MTVQKIAIPDLDSTPYCIVTQVLNNTTYYFEYTWNIRHDKAYLSIYIILNDEKIYLLRNKLLTVGINLSKYIYNSDNWTGNLYFEYSDFSYNFDYNQNNISTDYVLRYVI